MDSLCTLPDVKSYLDIPSGNTNADAILSSLILGVSAYALNQSNMPDREDGEDPTFFEDDYVEHYDGHGNHLLLLRHGAPTTPVTRVSAVTVNGVAIPKAGEAPSRGFVWTSKQVLLRGYRFWKGVQNVRVKYTAGVDPNGSTGQALKSASAEWIAMIYKVRPHIDIRAKTLDRETVSFMQSAMPTRMQAVLTNLMPRVAA